jgi:mannan endo-1,4-beta-mannosidase
MIGALAGCGSARLEVLSRGSSGFLQRSGDGLFLDGNPYRSLGFAAYTLTGCGGSPNVPDDAQLDAFFASLRPRSLVRTYAFAPLGLDAVDRVVRAAKARGHLLTLVLTDHDSSCGEGEVSKTPEFYESGFRDAFLPWVDTVVSRYANEPAIGFWEVAKAPTDVDAATLRTFFDVVGGEIHHLDSHHLVEPGIHGPWAYGGEDGYERIIASAGLDATSFIDYDAASDEIVNLEASLRVAQKVGKPLLLVEMSLYAGPTANPSDVEGGAPCVSWETRRTKIEKKLTSAFQQKLAAAEVWNWVPGNATGCGYSVPSNDPLFALVHDFVIP